MTVTTPPPRSRTPRPRADRRDAHSRVRAAIALTALLVVAVPSAAAPAVASSPLMSTGDTATPSPTPTPLAGELTGETTFTLSPVGNGVVRPGEGLAVSVSLHNGTAVTTTPIDVTLSLGATALRDRRALTGWLGGDTSGTAMTPVGTATFAAVASGGREVTGIVVAPDDPALAGRAPGVYPMSASYESPEGTVTSTSAMILPPDGAAEVGIGVVVPITAAATAEGLLTAAELTELTGPNGYLTDELDAVEGTASILAIDPAIPAAIRVLGTAAPATATEWLTRLEALPNSRFALQFGDADVAAQLQSGLTRPLRPLSLQYAMSPADFVPTDGATPSPSPTAVASDDPVYPTLAELTDIGDARAGVYWPGTGTATPEVVATLGEVVVDDRDSLTLVPSTSTRAGSSGATVPGTAIAGEAELLVYDADISRALNDASSVEENALRGAPLTAAAAYLAFAVADAGGEPIVVTVDRDVERSRVALRTAITSASQAPGVTPLTLGGLATRDPVGVEIADAAADEVRADAASVLVEEEGALARFATILDDVSLLTGPERAEILQLLGLGWIPDTAGWQTALDSHRATTITTLDSVGILPPSPINLFSAGAPIPIWVRNDLPYPVNVVLYATPDDLRLDVAKATEATAGPQSNTRVQVPVQARVGNGEVTVQLQLRSRTLEPIGGAQTVDVNVRADWEGIGIVILSILVGGFILLGLVRTVLRLRRRAQRGVEGDPVAGSSAADATADPSDPAVSEDDR
ncbi:MAG: DUF6049 family protein [Microbacterium sp.]